MGLWHFASRRTTWDWTFRNANPPPFHPIATKLCNKHPGGWEIGLHFLATCQILNKRPRGLDALLDNLLVKEYQKCKHLGLRLAVSVMKHVQCTEWPQTELEDLTVKSTLYTLSTYPWGPNCGPFRSTISCFRDITCTGSAKFGNIPNEPKLNWKT